MGVPAALCPMVARVPIAFSSSIMAIRSPDRIGQLHARGMHYLHFHAAPRKTDGIMAAGEVTSDILSEAYPQLGNHFFEAVRQT